MFSLDVYVTLVCACLVLLLGQFLIKHVGVLNRYTIPAPVAGGLLVAFSLLIVKMAFGWQVKFDLSLQTPLMLMFFSSIGLNANIKQLKAGGKMILFFLIAVSGLLLIQNAVGVGLARLLGIEPLMGLLAGSITLSGGHGTGAAWSKVFIDKYGFATANEVAMACATFGLVLGGLIGGPVARFLITRNKLESTQSADASSASFVKRFSGEDEAGEGPRHITTSALIETITMMIVCLTVGGYLADSLKGTLFELPVFVCVLFTGAVISNVLPLFGYKMFGEATTVSGNVCLSLFLSMALMSLRLWELASLAVPMITILSIQTALMVTYAIFVTFPVMGKTYDAAILCAGHCGFGLGATPTAIANMQVVTDKYGPSPVAFIVVPMVGAFFIDILNAIVIKLYLLLPFFGA